MASSFTNIKRKSTRSPQSRNLKPLVYLVAIGLLIAFIYTGITLITSRGDDVVAEVALPSELLTELSDIEAFKKAYMSVNGNEALLKQVQTIRVSGLIDQGDSSLTFVLFKKRPGQMRLIADHGSYEMTYGVSGGTVWQRIRRLQHEDSFALIEGDAAGAWLEQSRFFDRIINACLGEGSLTAIEVADWQGTPCLKVRTRDVAGKVVDFLIAPQTMHPIAEIEWFDEGASRKQTVFSDYRDIGGMPVPFGLVFSVDGKEESRIKIDRATLNSGVPSYMFELPAELTTSDEGGEANMGELDEGAGEMVPQSQATTSSFNQRSAFNSTRGAGSSSFGELSPFDANQPRPSERRRGTAVPINAQP